MPARPLTPVLRPLPSLATAVDCTIVVPTYDELDNVGRLIHCVLEEPRFRVLVVDDGSPDGTGDLVADIARREPRVELISRPGKLGLGSAYRAGFRHALDAGAELVFEMDADFSHDPSYLPRLLEAAESGADLVLGSRYVPGGDTVGWGAFRRWLSRSGNFYARTVLGLPVADATSGFRCYRRRVLETIDLAAVRSSGYAFQVEMVHRTLRAGFRIAEVPIVFPDRAVGRSKMSAGIALEAMINVLRLRFGWM